MMPKHNKPSQPAKKFVAVMNIPSPYRLYLLTELWHLLSDRGIIMHVHFMSRGHENRPKSWLNPKIEFPHTYWKDFGLGIYHFNPGLILKMIGSKPEWMMCGSSFDTFTGIFVQLLCRAKIKICWLEGNTKNPGKLDGFIGWFKRFIISRCKYAAVPGEESAKYIGLHQERTEMKMPKPIYLPNLVDESRFNGNDRHKNETRVCIIPARLEPVKGLVPLFKLLTPKMLKTWKIKLLGQGSQKEEIFSIVKERGLENYVQILDYVSYDEMPKWYSNADLLLLPSLSDPNPLSVVEALHSGLAIALSDQAGNVTEAVTEGRNGWILPVLDKEAFLSKLREIFSTPLPVLREMGHKSKTENAVFWHTQKSIRKFVGEILCDRGLRI